MIRRVSRLLFRTVLALVCVLAALVGPSAAFAEQATRFPGVPPAEGDYDISNGHFFTEAAPGQGGAGYRVANEAGIPFWDAFQDQGGVGKLGYPLSRRFIVKDSIVQVFQSGALRWNAKESVAEVIAAKDAGTPPAEAKRAESPLRLSAEAAREPWSGWWWPANDVVGGPRLFDADGPLARFDRYVETLGRPNPSTLEWERQEIRFARLAWAGHCNGWAAAALLEPEPTTERTLNGVTFSVADQKGLLTSYHFADSVVWSVGSDDQDATPAEFHRAVLTSLGTDRKGAIFTFRPAGDQEVWSYPAARFETEIGPDPLEADLWHVKTTVWLVDNEVPAGAVGSRPWPSAAGKTFQYTLRGNDPYNPRDGEWGTANTGRFGHPYMVWYPDPARRNIDRQLTSPDLDYKIVLQVVRGLDVKPLFDPHVRKN